MDRKTAVWIAVIFAVALVVSTYVWASYNRYYIVGTGGNFSYEVDRLTGKTWFVSHNKKTLVAD